MHLQIFLVLALTISLAGISYIENVNAANGHDFESQWGQAGISKTGFFLSPQHLAFDSENNIYVTDLGNSRVQKFDSTGNFLAEWGNRGSNDGEFLNSCISGINNIDKLIIRNGYSPWRFKKSSILSESTPF
jgi:hypothetical protein